MTEVSLKDCLKHPIWEWALDEETLPGHDETWQRPIISTKDVTPDITDPIITFQISGSKIVGTAIYDHEKNSLTSISICDGDEWEDVCDLSDIQMPVELIALPTICGVAGARFLLTDSKCDLATRLASDAPKIPATSQENRQKKIEPTLAFILKAGVYSGHMCSCADRVFPEMPGLHVCPACGFRTDFEFTNPDFRVPFRKYDFLATYDWAEIASEKLKNFCEANGLTGLRFIPLPKSKGFFHFIVDNVLPLDEERIGLKKQKLCSQCGNYREVFGLFTRHLRNLTIPLGDGIWRSDVRIGSGNMKHSVLYVGSVTRDKMKQANLKGVHFDKYP